LIIANSRGAIWAVAPEDGTATEVADLKAELSLPPIVANNTLYILDDSGRISAFRG
jgi:tricorn protease-like protein